MNYLLHKELLAKGETVQFRPKGNSMRPKIESGQLVTVSPDVSCLAQGDIVFCKVNGTFYVHLITATKRQGQDTLYQISNNKGHVNGWVASKSIFGKVISVAD